MTVIPCDLVHRGDRLRELNEAQVDSLVDSIAEVGVLSPITVYRRKVMKDHVAVDGYGLIAGLHRHEACKRLGLVEIPAQVVELDELRRQIAECDENLLGPKLTKAQLAKFTKRRKDAYLALHPETAYEARPGRAGKSRQVGDNSEPAVRFTADTASKTGRSERDVQRDAERGEKVCDEALALIEGTGLDTGTYLDTLKAIDRDKQVDRVRRDLAAREARERQEALRREEVERAKEAKEARERAVLEICNLLCDELPTAKYDRLVRLMDDAGWNVPAKALRKWMSPSEAA